MKKNNNRSIQGAINALLHKTCKEKQKNKGNVQLNGFITETRHLLAVCLR